MAAHCTHCAVSSQYVERKCQIVIKKIIGTFCEKGLKLCGNVGIVDECKHP